LTAREPAAAALGPWLDQHTARAPDALRRRVLAYAAAAPQGFPLAETLARAGAAALGRVLSVPGDRSVALDLLAADALVTLALLAQAERAPAELGRFAGSILQAYRAGS
jgi:hypothetical protein